MEVKEVARRILSHSKLLILFVVIGGLASLILRGEGGPAYVASSRLVVSTDLAAPALAMADIVAGIATSEARIAPVLAEAGLDDRDPGTVAEGVFVTPVAGGNVVDLAVRDSDADTAIWLARGLSAQVIEVMRLSGFAQAPLPYIVQTASRSTTRAVSDSGVQDVALGALLGLVLGVLFTALFEVNRPTIIGGDRVAA